MYSSNNVSKNVLMFAAVVSTAVFALSMLVPQVTSACEDCLGWVDTYGDNLGWVDTYGDNLGYVDTYGDNLGYVDTYGDNLGYVDTYGDNLGYVDTYGDNLGYVDTYGDNLGYVDTYGDNVGYVDTYGNCDSWCYSEYVSDCGGCSYSSSSGGTSYSYPRYSNGGSYSTPNYSYPRYSSGGSYSSPITVSSGRSYVQPSTPVVTSAPVHNTNNNVNNNTNVNNVNVSATAIAIAPAPVAQPVAAYIPPAPPIYTHPAPYCTITVTNQYGIGYGYGQQTLTWNSTNAHSASISPVIGSVTTNGSRIVSYLAGSMYTMTVWGPGGSATCHTQPMYAQVPVPTPVPAAPYVALTQIPYTGFDYGPVGNAMYWVSLALIAISGAYLMVYYRGGMLSFVGAVLGDRTDSRSARLAEFTPLPESAFAPVKSRVQTVNTARMGTVDAMSFIRSESGAPKIVISRN